ncbi:MAG TPA: GntR family transcriptional regulator [Jatrophihabitantaceae bacterium]|jgi:DNA-binding transcriptional regulator YhcF (GntR family)
MTVHLEIDSGSAVPPFEQVRRQLAEQINTGTLVVGTRLPPVRALAGSLGLAANTIARTYRELESAGLVETRGRGGTVVSSSGDRSRAKVRAAAERYAKVAAENGIAADEALRIVGDALG